MALQFTRNAKVFVQVTDKTTGRHKAAWQISVLDGFSFTQSVNSSEITINEAGATSRRARLLFNDSLAPVEWSMSTYARPFDGVGKVAGGCHAVEESLWAMLLGADTWNDTTKTYSNSALLGVSPSPATSNVNTLDNASSPGNNLNTFDFSASNISSMPDNWNVYFSFEDGSNKQLYKCEAAVANSASMDFDIDGIATIAWSGFAKTLSDEGKVTFAPSKTMTYTAAAGDAIDVTCTDHGFLQGDVVYLTFDSAADSALNGAYAVDSVTGANTFVVTLSESPGATSSFGTTGTVSLYVINEALSSSSNFIRNRISTLSLVRKDKLIGSPELVGGVSESAGTPGDNTAVDVYELVLTGGNFTVENNINYLTPEELGVVNAPLANITGARSISGSVTCYLDNSAESSKSGELFADLVSDTSTVRNIFDMSVNIGGEEASTPRIAFDLPTAHLEVPTINVEDLLTLEVNFHGQVSGGDVDKTNEATIIYKA